MRWILLCATASTLWGCGDNDPREWVPDEMPDIRLEDVEATVENVDLSVLNEYNPFAGGPGADYRLVAAYDVSAMRGMEKLMPEPPDPYEYVWNAPGRMQISCGPEKAPDGMGVFEAEAIANRMFPTLAVVLERLGEAPPLDPSRVRIALGTEQPEFFLEPTMLPRYLQISIEGDVPPRYKQQIKTQIQTYLCMEHKTGRGWRGGNGDQVRQALLLNPPDFQLPDRKYFGGQTEPVPALLGPPDACIVRSAGLDLGSKDRGLQGDTSLALIPSDVWGASLNWCQNYNPGHRYPGTRPITVSMSEVPEGEESQSPPRWTGVRVAMRSTTDRMLDQLIEVSVNNEIVVPEQPMFVETASGEPGLIDVVSKIPYTYPTVGPKGNPDKYTVLLVPNWQLVEGIRRMHAGDVLIARPNAGDGVQDGVGWLLDHPMHLFLMVPSDVTTFDPRDETDTRDWVNVARPMSGGTLGWKDWGYTIGMLVGRSPIALPGFVTPSWDQVKVAQRAAQQAVVLGSVSVLSVFLLAGIRRIKDLWTAVPDERVDFWPGPPKEEEGDEDALENLGGEEGGGEEG